MPKQTRGLTDVTVLGTEIRPEHLFLTQTRPNTSYEGGIVAWEGPTGTCY